LPFGEVPANRSITSAGTARLIAGIRPEHFEDAALLGDERSRGLTFRANIDVVESMGSEFYAYFTLEGEVAESEELADLAKDAGSESTGAEMIVARLDPASGVKQGQDAELWIDPEKIQYFDGDNGAALGREEAAARAS
jgi:multiple sugar transport system ATP-binding protein